MHENSFRLFEKYAAPFFRPGMRVLEIGPSGSTRRTYRSAVEGLDLTWDTLDICERPGLTYSNVPEYDFPIATGTYDLVLAGNVLEHVRKPWVWVRELARITRPDGFVVTVNPVSWPYHEAPVDCWRVYPEGMRALYEEAGLKVELSRAEALADTGLSNVVHGRGLDWQGRKKRVIAKLLAPFGFPVELALDTVTVGRKPVTAEDGPASLVS